MEAQRQQHRRAEPRRGEAGKTEKKPKKEKEQEQANERKKRSGMNKEVRQTKERRTEEREEEQKQREELMEQGEVVWQEKKERRKTRSRDCRINPEGRANGIPRGGASERFDALIFTNHQPAVSEK